MNTTIPAMNINATIILSGSRGAYSIEKSGRGGWLVKHGFTSKRAALAYARSLVGPLAMSRAI